MNSRYQETTAIVFSDEIIPFWKCTYDKTDCGDTFYYNNESSTHTQPAVWDCKKEQFISFYTVENKVKPIFNVGDKVVYTEGYNHEALLTEITEVYESDAEKYYAKCKDKKDSVRLVGHNVPEHTKVIIYYTTSYGYRVKGIDKDVHPLYIHRIKELV